MQAHVTHSASDGATCRTRPRASRIRRMEAEQRSLSRTRALRAKLCAPEEGGFGTYAFTLPYFFVSADLWQG